MDKNHEYANSRSTIRVFVPYSWMGLPERTIQE